MGNLYSDNILDHYQHPRRKGELATATLHEHDANPLCGDDLTLDLDVDERGRIAQCRFHGHGCAISVAAADMLCLHVEGMSLADVARMNKDEMLALLGIELGPVRVKCGLLAYKIARVASLRRLAALEGES